MKSWIRYYNPMTWVSLSRANGAIHNLWIRQDTFTTKPKFVEICKTGNVLVGKNWNVMPELKLQDYILFRLRENTLIQFLIHTIDWNKNHILCRNGILLPKLFWPTVRKNCSSDRENFWNSRLKARIPKIFEITRTIYSNSERSEQFLVKECSFNLFLEVSQIQKIRTIIIQIGKNYWDSDICRKSQKN